MWLVLCELGFCYCDLYMCVCEKLDSWVFVGLDLLVLNYVVG